MSEGARISSLATALVDAASANGIKIAIAESCTGGLVGAALTETPGSSIVFDRGFITYSNNAKIEMLGVDPALIDEFGAVSGEVARAMALGAVSQSAAHIAVSVTGIAGPGGGSDDKPVGLVWFGLAMQGEAARIEQRNFTGGSRRFVRLEATETALQLLLDGVKAKS